MADFLTRKERSERMSRIRGANTAPEMTLRRGLHKKGFRYSLHAKGLPGKPDLVLRRYHTVIFVHGCFWHRHKGCRVASTPKSNVAFWREKFRRNIKRDRTNLKALNMQGWRTIIVWECELSGKGRANKTIDRVSRKLVTIAANRIH